MITSKNYSNVKMVLRHKPTDILVHTGAQIKDFRGEPALIMSGNAPHKPSSSGKIYVEYSRTDKREVYPGVFNCEWVAQ